MTDPPDDPKASLFMTIEKAVFCNIIIPLQRLCDVHVVRPSGGDFSIFLLSLQQVVLKKGPVDLMKDKLMPMRGDLIPIEDQLTRVDFRYSRLVNPKSQHRYRVDQHLVAGA